MTRLFVDSVLNPPIDNVNDWAVVRSYDEAVKWMQTHPFPHYVSFGHNPQSEDWRSSLEFAEWLIEFDCSNGRMPYDFSFDVHADDPVAASLLRTKMTTYCWFKQNLDWCNPSHKKGPIAIIAA